MRITRNAVKVIIYNLLGEYPVHISKINNGNTNKIYKATLTANTWLIVRISPHQDKINGYLKEQWCSNQARKLNLPTPEILEVGNDVIPYPYMVVKEILGIPGNQYEGDKTKMLTSIGEYASMIHTIKTEGYGEIFDWSSNVLSKQTSWDDYLEKGLHLNERIEFYERSKGSILSEENYKKLENAVKKIRNLKFEPSLAHGDFLPKNVIVNNAGEVISIIDWESAKSHAATYWDLSTTLNNIKEEERELVVKGYKLPQKEFKTIEREIDALWVLKKWDVVAPAFENQKKDEVKSYATKLNNALNRHKV
jgi:aminoglycoside phosphotransferase (APT) family kinase protein